MSEATSSISLKIYIEEANIENKNIVILVAAWLGRARLLDNQLVVVG